MLLWWVHDLCTAILLESSIKYVFLGCMNSHTYCLDSAIISMQMFQGLVRL